MRVGNETGLVRSANGVRTFLVVELNFKRAIFITLIFSRSIMLLQLTLSPISVLLTHILSDPSLL